MGAVENNNRKSKSARKQREKQVIQEIRRKIEDRDNVKKEERSATQTERMLRQEERTEEAFNSLRNTKFRGRKEGESMGAYRRALKENIGQSLRELHVKTSSSKQKRKEFMKEKKRKERERKQQQQGGRGGRRRGDDDDDDTAARFQNHGKIAFGEVNDRPPDLSQFRFK